MFEHHEIDSNFVSEELISYSMVTCVAKSQNFTNEKVFSTTSILARSQLTLDKETTYCHVTCVTATNKKISINGSAFNEQYDCVWQIARLNNMGVQWRVINFRITNEVTSLVLRIFLDQEIFFGSSLVLFT